MRACRAVLDFEPAWPGGAVKTERKGSGSFVLRAHGRAAHAGADLGEGRERHPGDRAPVAGGERAHRSRARRHASTSASCAAARAPTSCPTWRRPRSTSACARVEDGRALEAAVRALRSTTRG